MTIGAGYKILQSNELINSFLDGDYHQNEVFEELKPSSMKDMGNLMKVISSKITNADMSLVSKIVKDKLLS